MQETLSTCCYCGVGCGVIIEHENNRITGVRGNPEHPANFGRLCTKGSTLHLTARHETRLLYPQLRTSKTEPRQRIGWDDALAHAAKQFANAIEQHGPDSVAFYISGQLLTEDYYLFNKLAKGLIGTNNVDTNSRLCMSSAVAAYKQTLGADAPPCCYDDFALTDCLLIAGSNPAYAHPIAFRRIEDAKKANPNLKMIVVDPRRTDTASMADIHLAILPGTDIWLFNAMLHVLLWDGLTDNAFIQNHTEGFDALREHVREITPAVAAQVCGIKAEEIVAAARLWGQSPRAMSLWCQGLNQSHHGTHNGAALIALSLATGKIGKPGSGPFSLTGQPNAMGGREVGGLANLLSAHRDMANPEHRKEVAALWGIDDVPSQPGLTAVELFKAVNEGKIKALWIACTNPAQSMPDQNLIHDALAKCDYVVLQEAYGHTETTPYADLLLPATSWGEKEGTVTNSERRITRVQAAVAAPGETRHDWQIVRDFALQLGQHLTHKPAAKMFDYPTPESVFSEHAETTRGRDLDITGLNYAILETQGPQQWPFPEGATEGRARLYEDHQFVTPNGKARFVVPVQTTTVEKTDARYPLHLLTGRLRDQWHGMSRTGTVARLYNHVDEPRIEMNQADMERRGIGNGTLVRIKSRRASIVMRALSSTEMRPGQTFISMHWGENVLGHAGANALMHGGFDPYSKQPELKHAAVQVEVVDLPHQALLLRCELNDEASQAKTLERAKTLAPLLKQFTYASLTLGGRDYPAVVLRVAHDQPISDEQLAQLDQIMGLNNNDCLTYKDPRRGISKRALVQDGLLIGLRLTGEMAAAAWLRETMLERLPTQELRRWLLAPVATPPTSAPSRGKVICNCFNVAERDISACMTPTATLEELQDKLKCGTSCGSCVPELKRILAAGKQVA